MLPAQCLILEENRKSTECLVALKTTSRQREVLNLLSEGYSAKEIASLLFISHHTVISHGNILKEKLNAKNCTHLVAKAVRMGLI